MADEADGEESSIRMENIEQHGNTTRKSTKSPAKSSNLFSKLPQMPQIESRQSTSSSAITNAPNLSCAFDQMPNLDGFLRDSLATLGILNPTDIQKSVIPRLLSDLSPSESSNTSPDNMRDYIVQAQTGSGKTFAYLLPVLHDLIQCQIGDRKVAGCLALIIVPTRELCQQLYDTIYSLLYSKSPPTSSTTTTTPDSTHHHNHDISNGAGCLVKTKYRWIVPGILCGGQCKKSEKARIRKGLPIIIATPGRLVDHLRSTQALQLSSLRWLIMDEADRFDEMGMRDSLKELWSCLAQATSVATNYRKVLCSATISSDIVELGGIQLNKALFLSSSSSPSTLDESTSADGFIPGQIKTTFMSIPAKLRLVMLATMLKLIFNRNHLSKTIVFFSNCAAVEFYHSLLQSCLQYFPTLPRGVSENDEDESKECKIPMHKLHGSISHQDRMKTLKQFKSGILFTTDLAARGLDFPGITEIIQYDIPNDIMACLHRIGRTARCGSGGKAFIFVMPHESDWIKYVESEAGLSGDIKSFEDVITDIDRELLRPIKKMGSAREELASWQRRFEEHTNKSLAKQARDAYMTSVRAYATHPKEIRQVLSVKKLHLGHFCKSFALREAPSKLVSKTAVKKRKLEISRASNNAPDKRHQLMKASARHMNNTASEFSSF